MNMLKNGDQNENETKNNYTVYIHTNKTNNKKYVGITSRTPEERWMSNGLGYRGQGFYNAIQKYGWDSFDHIILHSCLSAAEASEYSGANPSNIVKCCKNKIKSSMGYVWKYNFDALIVKS